MIITCPSCESQYILPDDAIGPKGRRVKCTSCSYTWLEPAPTQSEDVVEAKAFYFDPEKTSTKRDVYDPRAEVPVVSTPWGRIVAVGIGFAVLLFVISVIFLVIARPGLTPSWPPLALLYERIGFPVPAPGDGLVFEDITMAFEGPNKTMVRITGKITNSSSVDKVLPKLLVRLSGESGWLKDWPIDLYGKTLVAGETAGFQYLLQDAPPGGRDITLRFDE